LHWQKKKEEGEIDPVIIIIIPTYIPLSNDGDANYANEDIKTIIKRSSGEYVLVDPPHTMRGFRGYTVWLYHVRCSIWWLRSSSPFNGLQDGEVISLAEERFQLAYWT
jgi:hypothetical protein